MAENEAEQKAGGGLVKKLLIFGGGGLVMIAVGLGAGWLIFGSAQPDPSEEIEEIIERKLAERETAEAEADNSTEPQKQSKDTPEEDVFETIYHEFAGTFTTNLDGSRKMLQLGIGVSTQYDDTVMMNVESHQLALRSVILGVISNFSEEDVKGSAGREMLAVSIRDAINGKLEALENFGGIEEVHFTSFVLQ
ncbi:MAG: flagellar biosynthesis protein FliL [SAR116 cluster bacterium]|jgi:flagellar FliL protein|nr:flagellar biosynthesis protein FliL [SAR116 cluster bacterium]MEC8661968.1 flagellar basal body-associated FliL family protein [Pseudomonadota bacterium]